MPLPTRTFSFGLLSLGASVVASLGAGVPAFALSSKPAAEIVIVQPQRPDGPPETLEDCRTRLAKLFKEQNLDPTAEKSRAAIDGYCTSGSRELVLVSQKKPKDPVLTIDATGSYSHGNVNSGSLTGAVGYKQEWQRHALEVALTGEYESENNGFTYQRMAASVQDEFFLNNHWSLFGYATVGRDTKRELAFSASEFVGVIFNVLGRDNAHQIKISSAIGHRYEERLDGTLTTVSEDDHAIGFANNNAVASHRIKYTGKFLDDTVELMAAAWFQHILYSPAQNGLAERWMDFSDYRAILQLQIKVKIAELGASSELYFEFGGTYEYFSKTLAQSNDDLTIQGGIGVRF